MSGTDTNHDGSNRSSNNDVAVLVPVAVPKNAEEFRSLCDALQRNDPNVTGVSTRYLSGIDQGCGRDLGHALQRNTFVSEIVLELPYLVTNRSGRERNNLVQQPKLIDERMASLHHWMRHSSSLRSVKLYFGWHEVLHEILFEQISDALVNHQNILSLESYTSRVSLSVLTPIFQANTSLQTLKIHTNSFQVDDSDDVFEESACAVAALHQLEVLWIGTRQIDPFLRQLPTSPAFNTTLRDLTLDFQDPTMHWRGLEMEFQASALCRVLSDTSCRLQRLELRCLDLKENSWTLLSSALLRSNPSSLLHTLVLNEVNFWEEVASSLFLRDMQSDPRVPFEQQPPEPRLPEPEQEAIQHILDLRLTFCSFGSQRKGTKLGNMLCGSLLRHITLDLYNLERQERYDFFDVLTTRGTASCLQSMHIENANVNDLRRLAPYVAATVHLRDLTVELYHGPEDGDVPVPNIFLLSLRQNGSLHNVDLSTNGCTPNEANVRRIQVYMTRNRVLPQLMATTSFGSRHATGNANHHGNEAAEAPSVARSAPALASSPSASAFPMLGAVAEHAPQMAPNNFLKAFLAASKSLVPS